ncbi:MAG TPA: rod shape-determining protein RodA [Candidatus Deferrimicrobium sp.]|nr:rod shape-determining protein RodA [Candidatus Deferrimicrobium sp.]
MKPSYLELDWKLIAAALALSLIGIALIMSAQYGTRPDSEPVYFLRQIVWLVIALFVSAAVLRVPLRLFELGAYLFYAFAVLLLILVLLVGSARMGASRWFSFGPINFSPSDLAKLALIVALSRFFAYTKFPPTSKRRLAVSALLAVVPAILVLKQPDLGTSLVFFVILAALWFWSGLSPWYLLVIVSPLAALFAATNEVLLVLYFAVLLGGLFLLRPGLLFAVIAVAANLGSAMITQLVWNRLERYQQLRLEAFLNPATDPRGAGYQIIQSKIAIGSGGFWGKGPFHGSQARLDFLPEQHTDFVFSVLGEEYGLWGALIVLGLFTFILYRSIRIAGRCRSRFISNLVVGTVAVLMFQYLVNVGMTLGLMPVTGLPLPFVSYGGTSLVLCWVIIALIVQAEHHRLDY